MGYFDVRVFFMKGVVFIKKKMWTACENLDL